MKTLVLQHVPCEGLGLLADFFAARSITYDVVRLDWGEPIPSLADYATLVILGGPMNVYEEERFPHLREEDAAIKRALDRNIACLGICLGAQLLAKALGAPVSPNATREIGFYDIQLTENGMKDRLFRGLGPKIPVFQWHGDTFAVPAGAVHLATSPLCPHQAFRYGDNAYALQFHLEVTPDMVESWVAEYREELVSTLGAARGPALVAKARELEWAFRKQAWQAFANFWDDAR